MIIDCDPGIDDSLAIMMALTAKEIEVVGITVVCGNAPVQMGAENARKVLKHMNRLDVPVLIGADKPLKKPYTDALDTHGRDGLGESFLENAEGPLNTESANSFLRRKLREERCSIIAIGPLTNLAHLIETDEDAFACIDRLISMGGNYRSHGNCSPVAEYNYWEDPEAASIVYQQMEKMGKQIEMIGLDVTRQIVLTPDLLSYIERLDPHEGAFIRKITKFYFDFHWQWEHLIGCVINDPLAVACFLDPEVCRGFSAHVEIAEEGICRGQSVVDAYDFYRRAHNAVVYDQVDVIEFFYMFLERILRCDRARLDLLDHLLRNHDAYGKEGERDIRI